jgi:hypothetical protein
MSFIIQNTIVLCEVLKDRILITQLVELAIGDLLSGFGGRVDYLDYAIPIAGFELRVDVSKVIPVERNLFAPYF